MFNYNVRQGLKLQIATLL